MLYCVEYRDLPWKTTFFYYYVVVVVSYKHLSPAYIYKLPPGQLPNKNLGSIHLEHIFVNGVLWLWFGMLCVFCAHFWRVADGDAGYGRDAVGWGFRKRGVSQKEKSVSIVNNSGAARSCRVNGPARGGRQILWKDIGHLPGDGDGRGFDRFGGHDEEGV